VSNLPVRLLLPILDLDKVSYEIVELNKKEEAPQLEKEEV